MTSSGGIEMGRGTRSAGGFTLIELMVVVAIVAILVAIAYPSFADAIRKSRRGQAKADMVQAAQMMERFHTQNNTYVGATIPGQSPATGTPNYVLDVNPVATQATFRIRAVPQGAQTADTRCGTLTINQAGVKTESGTAPDFSECW